MYDCSTAEHPSFTVEYGESGPWDRRGNPFITYLVRGACQKNFDKACERAGAKLVIVREAYERGEEFKVRFTAYDNHGACISEQVTKCLQTKNA